METEALERGAACLTLDFRSLFDNELASDVIVDLDARGETASLLAHRIVLIVCRP